MLLAYGEFTLCLTKIKNRLSNLNPRQKLLKMHQCAMAIGCCCGMVTGLSAISIMDCQLVGQKVRQKISVIKTNTSDDNTKIVYFWHSYSRFVLKTKNQKCLF